MLLLFTTANAAESTQLRENELHFFLHLTVIRVVNVAQLAGPSVYLISWSSKVLFVCIGAIPQEGIAVTEDII